MNIKEIAEIRRRIRRDRSNMPAVHGCYVNDKKEIVCRFRQSTAMMSENEAEKYFGLLKRSLSGTVGKNLIDICFKTSQVADSAEHRLLMALRDNTDDEETLSRFFRTVIDASPLEGSYVILLGCDKYDVPFKSKDGSDDSGRSDEQFRYILCAICPVKETKPTLHYIPENKVFHDGGITNVVSAPELGFMFPAFDDRATNIYNALYYTHSPKESHTSFVDAVFCTQIPVPAAQQKKDFEALLSTSLAEECSMDVMQSVHAELCHRIELHKESRVPETLMISKDEVKDILSSCGVTEPSMARFSIQYDDTFGFEAELHPKNIIDNRRFEVSLPDISIRIAPEKADLIETRVIGGVKYLLINAEEDIEVNGVSIHIHDRQKEESKV